MLLIRFRVGGIKTEKSTLLLIKSWPGVVLVVYYLWTTTSPALLAPFLGSQLLNKEEEAHYVKDSDEGEEIDAERCAARFASLLSTEENSTLNPQKAKKPPSKLIIIKYTSSLFSCCCSFSKETLEILNSPCNRFLCGTFVIFVIYLTICLQHDLLHFGIHL